MFKLKFKNVRGAMPQLKLLDASGNVLEHLKYVVDQAFTHTSIEKWDTDAVEEFLTERLEP
jgi:hypothetical protein